ncbi:MAG: DNA mismatch repair protein MutS [Deltaproteobacteria bacterium]|nr:DNA mismatch repair protein MutS [Deltaproteobacteria bacterium]MBW2626664.1 DNA mismatch repair protein MutS [Deltaproteobacteria bacterium]
MGVRGTARKKDHTPVMRQFLRAKGQHPDAIIFFRLGDFYEMFYEDAVRAADILDIALTSRGTDPDGSKIPMAGVPHHAGAGYLAALLRHGEKVAICEQMGDPSSVRGVVPREVVRVVTPGLCLEPDALDARSENFLVAATRDGGVAALELSTGTLRACVIEMGPQWVGELVRLDPAEVLIESGAKELEALCKQSLPNAALRTVEFTNGAEDLGETLTAEQAAELSSQEPAGRAAALVLGYARAHQAASQIHQATLYTAGDRLVLDDAAVRNLELVRTLDGERRGSLLDLLDETKTPMGARGLRSRLLEPLTDIERIRRRHDAVELFFIDARCRDRCRARLGEIGDVERLAVRTAVGLATPRDLGVIRNSLVSAAALHQQLTERPGTDLDDAMASLQRADLCPDVLAILQAALVDEPPSIDRQGGIFADGHLDELDALRKLSTTAKDIVLDLERRERERTGIASLKIKFTRVFGYYIEITKSKLDAVPDEYVRKQTIANGERFITAELAELQDRILHADERARALESAAFLDLRKAIGDEAPRLHRLARVIASIDTSAALAEVAHRRGYVRPDVDGTRELFLEDSRHPTVECYAAKDGFVPNTIELDPDATRLMLLTGPNMSGKSTTMRQAALAVIMAQAGGFVAAKSARIGIVDRVYTRVGASDHLARGQSTFMVEMMEASAILRGATERSFVILDEIGRGTSTYDGLAIAWAVAEHLHDATRCRAIFATHYHELCELADRLPNAANYNVAAREHDDSMVLLHQLVPGGSNRSYGLAVARLAGVPPVVLARAKAKLQELETRVEATPAPQMPLFEPTQPQKSEAEATLRALDVDRMTPVDALVTLARLRDLASRDEE